MDILLVKLSSLGDVVHTMPAVQDLRAAVPNARIDWVVERGFAALAARCEGVDRVVPVELRRWRRELLAARTREAWRSFRAELQSREYDAIVDLQGLTKSALVSRVARTKPQGKRYALANRTEGSSYEPASRWVADVAVRIEPRVHAVQRARELCARAFGYAVPALLHYGLNARADAVGDGIAFIHGTSRADKCWPEAHWIALGRELAAQGARLVLPHGSDAEEAAAQRIAQGIGPAASVWPRLPLDELVDRLAACAGAVGVDSGLSHVAVALGLPHVQVYNFDTAWRTGPEGNPRQRSVFGSPTPPVDAVSAAWRQVTIA